jgi:hypothetical protein
LLHKGPIPSKLIYLRCGRLENRCILVTPQRVSPRPPLLLLLALAPLSTLSPADTAAALVPPIPFIPPLLPRPSPLPPLLPAVAILPLARLPITLPPAAAAAAAIPVAPPAQRVYLPRPLHLAAPALHSRKIPSPIPVPVSAATLLLLARLLALPAAPAAAGAAPPAALLPLFLAAHAPPLRLALLKLGVTSATVASRVQMSHT